MSWHKNNMSIWLGKYGMKNFGLEDFEVEDDDRENFNGT